MAFVALMWLAGATFLFIQGMHVFRTGQVTLLFAKPEHRQSPRGPLGRLAWACFYLATSGGMMLLLANKLERIGPSPLKAWLGNNSGICSGLLCWLLLAFYICCNLPKCFAGRSALTRALRTTAQS